MKSQWKIGLCLVALMAATAFVTSQVVGQDAAPQDDDMARMMELGTPGQHHEVLKKMAGTWSLDARWRMSKDAPWEPSKMTSTAEAIMGGRYLLEKVEGEVEMAPGQKMPFEGMGIMGYDNFKKEYYSIWLDNMVTAPYFEHGTKSGEDKITLTGENLDAMAGKIVKTKSVLTLHDDGGHKVEMYSPDASGELFKAMEITYTRK